MRVSIPFSLIAVTISLLAGVDAAPSGWASTAILREISPNTPVVVWAIGIYRLIMTTLKFVESTWVAGLSWNHGSPRPCSRSGPRTKWSGTSTHTPRLLARTKRGAACRSIGDHGLPRMTLRKSRRRGWITFAFPLDTGPSLPFLVTHMSKGSSRYWIKLLGGPEVRVSRSCWIYMEVRRFATPQAAPSNVLQLPVLKTVTTTRAARVPSTGKRAIPSDRRWMPSKGSCSVMPRNPMSWRRSNSSTNPLGSPWIWIWWKIFTSKGTMTPFVWSHRSEIPWWFSMMRFKGLNTGMGSWAPGPASITSCWTCTGIKFSVKAKSIWRPRGTSRRRVRRARRCGMQTNGPSWANGAGRWPSSSFLERPRVGSGANRLAAAPNGSTAWGRAPGMTVRCPVSGAWGAATGSTPAPSRACRPTTSLISGATSKRSWTPTSNAPAGSFGPGKRRAHRNGTCRSCCRTGSFRSRWRIGNIRTNAGIRG